MFTQPRGKVVNRKFISALGILLKHASLLLIPRDRDLNSLISLSDETDKKPIEIHWLHMVAQEYPTIILNFSLF